MQKIQTINQDHSLIQSWHIEDLLLKITFGMPRYAWPHPYERTKLCRSIYVCLTTWETIKFIPKFTSEI